MGNFMVNAEGREEHHKFEDNGKSSNKLPVASKSLQINDCLGFTL